MFVSLGSLSGGRRSSSALSPARSRHHIVSGPRKRPSRRSSDRLRAGLLSTFRSASIAIRLKASPILGMRGDSRLHYLAVVVNEAPYGAAISWAARLMGDLVRARPSQTGPRLLFGRGPFNPSDPSQCQTNPKKSQTCRSSTPWASPLSCGSSWRSYSFGGCTGFGDIGARPLCRRVNAAGMDGWSAARGTGDCLSVWGLWFLRSICVPTWPGQQHLRSANCGTRRDNHAQ